MSDFICYVDGQFVPFSQACLPLDDLSISRGYSVFDALRTYSGKPFRLREHLVRLVRSADVIGLQLPWTIAELEEIVRATLARNTFSEVSIRVQVTAGPATDFITPLGKPRLLVVLLPPRIQPPEAYARGIKVITAHIDRALPEAKTIDYIPAMLALNRARAQGAVEALYVDQQGHVLEGMTSNFFVWEGERLITPTAGILAGITRQVVLELARQRFEVVERAIPVAELGQVAEAFIASTGREVMPVVQIDERIIGDRQPGPMTLTLRRMFREMVESRQAV